MFGNAFVRHRLWCFILIVTGLLVPTVSISAQGGGDLFVGNFGGHIPNGITYDLESGVTEILNLGNHGAPGSTLNIRRITFTPGPASSVSVSGLLAAPVIITSPSPDDQFTVECGINFTTTTFGTLTIVSDDANEPNYTLTFRCLGLPNLFVGHVAGHMPSGGVVELAAGQSTTFLVANRGGVGSLLTIEDTTVNNHSPTSFMRVSLAISPPVELPYSTLGQPLSVRCEASVPEETTGTAQVRIESDDPNEPNYVITFTCSA